MLFSHFETGTPGITFCQVMITAAFKTIPGCYIAVFSIRRTKQICDIGDKLRED